jgi:hypothetical protein
MTPDIRFIITTALLAFIIKLPAGILGSALVDTLGLHNPLYSSAAQEPTFTLDDMLLALALAPFIETIIAQLLPIEILSRITQIPWLLIGTSASLFMLFHYPVIEFFPSAFAVGCVFGWAWLKKRHLGVMKAFWIVTLIHGLHNALVAAVAALVL